MTDQPAAGSLPHPAPETPSRPGPVRAVLDAIEPVPARRPLSQLLADLGEGEGPRISMAEIVTSLSDRGFAALLILFGAPNIIPIIPGSSLLLGIPLVFVASQLVLGRPRVWLPRRLAAREVERATLAAFARRLAPWLARFERIARPRWWTDPPVIAERAAGAVALLMSVLILLPIPFGNSVPAAALLLVSISLTERDGVWLAIGTLVAVAGLGIVAGFFAAVGFAAGAVIG